MSYFWKTRRKNSNDEWSVEIHESFSEFLDSMSEQAGSGFGLNVMSLDECINDEERRIRKFGIGEVHRAVANLNILCDKTADTFGVNDETCILEYDSNYTGHKSYLGALYHAAKIRWPELEHIIGELKGEQLKEEGPIVTLTDDEAL